MSTTNPYNGRWRWWYDAIADLLIARPDLSIQEIATRLGKHPNTIGAIMKADTFRSYLALRKQEYKAKLDDRILGKTAEIAALGLELIHESLSKRRDAVPLQMLVETTGDALDRLGFGAQKTPTVLIDQRGGTNNNVVLPQITQAELLEAQGALRRAENAKLVNGAAQSDTLIEHQSQHQMDEASNDTVVAAE